MMQKRPWLTRNAQRQIDSLQSKINTNKKTISSLKKNISNKKRWYNKSKWYQKSYRWAEFSAYSAAKGAEITALYTAIGGLETAKATANAALEVAKQAVRGIQAGADNFPIDADPRIVGLYSVLSVTTGGLQSAKLIIEGLKQSLGGLVQASSFNVEYGLGGILEIKRIYFEGSLNIVKGGNVSMAMQLILMKNNLDLDLAFSFQDPLKSADLLVKKLL